MTEQPDRPRWLINIDGVPGKIGWRDRDGNAVCPINARDLYNAYRYGYINGSKRNIPAKPQPVVHDFEAITTDETIGDRHDSNHD